MAYLPYLTFYIYQWGFFFLTRIFFPSTSTPFFCFSNFLPNKTHCLFS